MKRKTQKKHQIKAQRGVALITTLAIFFIIVLMGNLTFMAVQYELKDTGRNLKESRSELAADAALNWGLFLAQKPQAWTCATHDSTGDSLVDTSRNCTFSLSDTNAFYPGCSLLVNDSGWITTSPGSVGQSLYGTLNEELAFQVWYPDTLVVRVVGRSIVDGDTSETALLGNY